MCGYKAIIGILDLHHKTALDLFKWRFSQKAVSIIFGAGSEKERSAESSVSLEKRAYLVLNITICSSSARAPATQALRFLARATALFSESSRPHQASRATRRRCQQRSPLAT